MVMFYATKIGGKTKYPNMNPRQIIIGRSARRGRRKGRVWCSWTMMEEKT